MNILCVLYHFYCTFAVIEWFFFLYILIISPVIYFLGHLQQFSMFTADCAQGSLQMVLGTELWLAICKCLNPYATHLALIIAL